MRRRSSTPPSCPCRLIWRTLGVSRVSVGGAFAFAAIGAVVRAARELREQGTYSWLEDAAIGVAAVRSAFE